MILITGTDTGVGKTFFTTAILKYLLDTGRNVTGIKIVETGCRSECEDAKRISEVLGREIPPIFSFEKPVAPSVAERLERKKIDLEKIKNELKNLNKQYDTVIAEGAGGLLVPITGRYTFSDLAKDLNMEIAIVALNKLGVINHTLLTVKVCECSGLKIKGVFLNSYKSFDESINTNFKELKRLLEVPVYKFSGSDDISNFVEFF